MGPTDNDFEVMPPGTGNLLRRIQHALDLNVIARRKMLDGLKPDLERLIDGYLGRTLKDGPLRPMVPRAHRGPTRDPGV